jgi:hypothetical protein
LMHRERLFLAGKERIAQALMAYKCATQQMMIVAMKTGT